MFLRHFRYFLLINSGAMNAGVPIIKYIQIYPYYTTQSGNSDGKPTYLSKHNLPFIQNDTYACYILAFITLNAILYA